MINKEHSQTTAALRNKRNPQRALRLYNTLTGRVEPFHPARKGPTKMYVCGPTVYDYLHIGHARTYVFYDVLARYLRAKGFKLLFIVNMTDIDDKILERAEMLGTKERMLAEMYIEEAKRDLAAINIRSIDVFPKASERLSVAIKQIERLLTKDMAYAVRGNVYFDTSRFLDYGKLSKQSRTELLLRRIASSPDKKNQADFLLWRRWDNENESFASPFGRGRPGWHIEDTAISISILGPHYDIHGGGVDLIFPHHEAEIAQAESITGVKPFVRFWVHIEALTVEGKKMSKSLGNQITIKDILKKHSADSLRLFFLLYHYHREIDFRIGPLERERERIKKLCSVLSALDKLMDASSIEVLRKPETDFLSKIRKHERAFYDAMDNDLNTPLAIRHLFGAVDLTLELLSVAKTVPYSAFVRSVLFKMLQILGLCEDRLASRMTIAEPLPAAR